MRPTTALLLLCAALALAGLSAEANRGPTYRDPAPYERGGDWGEGRGRGRGEDEDYKKKPCNKKDDDDDDDKKKPCSKPPSKPEEPTYDWKCVKVCRPKKPHDNDDKHKDKYGDKNKKCSTKKWEHAWGQDD